MISYEIERCEFSIEFELHVKSILGTLSSGIEDMDPWWTHEMIQV